VTLIAQEIPKIGLVMEEVKIVRWLKRVGDNVIAGEPLLEVETEKSVVEIEAAVTGRLTEILAQVDSRAVVGDQVAWIDSSEARESGKQAAVLADVNFEIAAPAPPTTAPAARRSDRIPSTPVARKLAAEKGLDLSRVSGTGPGGRIQLEDVQKAIDAPDPADTAAPPLSPMRRALARAMSLSNATVPQFTVSRSVDWTVLRALRPDLSARLPVSAPKLSLNDYLLQAVARTLMEFPALNATFSGDPQSADARIIPASGVHIGLVVAIDDGLLVPVIDVGHLGLMQIARRREDGVERARAGRMRREEVGATFSISNLGAQGPDRFTAIINPPQSAILAVGRQRDCAVVREGAIVARPLSDLTLTVDHRVADGRLAARFLARVVAILEGGDWRLE
jgi:pyruvate dehydrogenase E2 component (dihydrolipoamide acetyltransferase)